MEFDTKDLSLIKLNYKVFEKLVGRQKAEELVKKILSEATEIQELCGDSVRAEELMARRSCVVTEVDKRSKRIIDDLDL